MTHTILFSLPYFIMEQFQAHKDIIIFVVIGLVSGFLAQMILPGRGFGILSTLAIGITGAWIGDKFVSQHMTFIEDPFFRAIAADVVCAMVLSVIINLIRGGEDKDLTHWRDR